MKRKMTVRSGIMLYNRIIEQVNHSNYLGYSLSVGNNQNFDILYVSIFCILYLSL
jgi:hypothetical protein